MHVKFPTLFVRRLIKHCLVSLLLIGSLASDVEATTYYVDSASGNDANSGTAANSAWQTLTKVNGQTFLPGDEILFKTGGSWVGTLSPRGSGINGNPIIVSSYGMNQTLPLINGNGNTDAVILSNQQYWEINNLEVINPASTDAERRGVHLCAANYGLASHLHVSNCYIHDIRGKVDTSNGDQVAKRSGGIVVEVTDDTVVATWFNDIIIQNCTISSVTNQGIVACANRGGGGDYPGTQAWNGRHCSNLIIRNNVINDVCKNAMSIRYCDESCLVEHNVMFNTAITTDGNTICSYSCRGTVFQYNEGYRNNGGRRHDGSLYDADLHSPETVWQYSYSHDNGWGLFVQYAAAGSQDTNVVVRYNISRNDKGDVFALTGDAKAISSEYIYNNTIYTPANLSPTLIDDRSNGHASRFCNNIFYNLSSTAIYHLTTGNSNYFDSNVFYGHHPVAEPGDAHKLTTDPKLIAPGTGDIGVNTVAGYKLRSGSSSIGSGLTISTNVTGNPNAGRLDYWGNRVPLNGATDRGANEWSGNAPIVSRPVPPPISR
jgi:hypothetical protein